MEGAQGAVVPLQLPGWLGEGEGAAKLQLMESVRFLPTAGYDFIPKFCWL